MIDCYVLDRFDYVLYVGQILIVWGALVEISFMEVMIEDFRDTWIVDLVS